MSWPRGAVLAVVVTALVTYAVHKVAGLPVQWSVLVALPVGAFVVLLLVTPPGVEPSWAPPPEPPFVVAHLDASTLAGRLEDAATDQSRYRTRVQPRLARIAVTALRRRPGLGDLADLADPRALAALGERWHTALTHPAATLPARTELLALLVFLEEQ